MLTSAVGVGEILRAFERIAQRAAKLRRAGLRPLFIAIGTARLSNMPASHAYEPNADTDARPVLRLVQS